MQRGGNSTWRLQSRSQCSVAVKRHHDQGNSYERKHLIGAGLQFQRISISYTIPYIFQIEIEIEDRGFDREFCDAASDILPVCFFLFSRG
ncbi:hypothetical protein STEG23_003590 [Scotinomys teguina]